jgi:hypothetical protein
MLPLWSWIPHSICCTSRHAEWPVPYRLVCVFLSLVNLLFESFGLLITCKRESNHAIFRLERVEKGSVLVVDERVEDFLIPNDATVRSLKDQHSY